MGGAIVEFEIDGQRLGAFDGGPMVKFNWAVSFVVRCDSQEEIDYYWERLSEGGEPSQCGWLQDKFGLSWQVIPAILPRSDGEERGGGDGRAAQDAEARHRGAAPGLRGRMRPPAARMARQAPYAG